MAQTMLITHYMIKLLCCNQGKIIAREIMKNNAVCEHIHDRRPLLIDPFRDEKKIKFCKIKKLYNYQWNQLDMLGQFTHIIINNYHADSYDKIN